MHHLTISLLIGVVCWSAASAQSEPSATHPSRILIKRHHAATRGDQQFRVPRIGALRTVRSNRLTHLLEVPAGADLDQVVRDLQNQPDVEYAVIEKRRRLHREADDTHYASQWFLKSSINEPAAIAANAAWDLTTGSNGIVVAVLDTGVRFNHPDLYPSGMGGKLLPGFDFVSNTRMANDGDGWDADPSDPGDWISRADLDRSDHFFDNCGDEGQPTDSTWHGTRVAGMIAAQSNNASGVTGVSWGAYILPVRVMGKCGGFDGDIIDAMRWAAGIAVTGAPLNPYPAKIINMSLGSPGACNVAYQNVIAELAHLGVSVVISAGNDGGRVNEPANCPGAIAVAGLRHAGTKVGFSSLGPEIAISAPAGNCVNLVGPCLLPLVSTTDAGITVPTGPTYAGSLGTSFSAPLVSGAIALMRSVNNKLSADSIRQRLRNGATTFPVNDVAPLCHVPMGPFDLQLEECTCTTSTCGAGMLNANNAAIEALRPIAFIATPTVTAGAATTLDASSSQAACGRSIATYLWSVESVSGTATPTITNDTAAVASVVAPLSGSFTLRVTVTDDQGASDSTTVTLTSTAPSTTSPTILSSPVCPIAVVPPASQPIPDPTPTTVSPPPRSGGGGGSLPLWLLTAFVALLGCRVIYRVRRRVVSNTR